MPEYCILRMPPEFPEYNVPSDIDILCDDLYKCQRFIEYRVDVVTIDRFDRQVQLDYMQDGALQLKFDLYGHYISDTFKEQALSTRIKHKGVFVAHPYFDNLSKCYEFLTHDKKKYREYKQYQKELNEYKS